MSSRKFPKTVIRKRQNGTSAIIEKYEIDPASINPSSRRKSMKLFPATLKKFNELSAVSFP